MIPEKRVLQITAADFDEQGSFCDTDSKHHYDNTENLGATVAARTAEDTGAEVWMNDAPSDADDNYGADQRFNLFSTERDGQGLETPIKHRPGR